MESITSVEAPPPSPRRKSAKPKLSGSVQPGKQPTSHVTVLFYRGLMVSIYVGLVVGLAFFLTIYYLFIWEPIRGKYSKHHVFVGHSSAVFHPEGR